MTRWGEASRRVWSFSAGGLTLGRVADHDPVALQRDAADLAGGREAGAAASGEAGLLEEGRQVDPFRQRAEGLDVLARDRGRGRRTGGESRSGR